jgi:hypothetical protein
MRLSSPTRLSYHSRPAVRETTVSEYLMQGPCLKSPGRAAKRHRVGKPHRSIPVSDRRQIPAILVFRDSQGFDGARSEIRTGLDLEVPDNGHFASSLGQNCLFCNFFPHFCWADQRPRGKFPIVANRELLRLSA